MSRPFTVPSVTCPPASAAAILGEAPAQLHASPATSQSVMSPRVWGFTAPTAVLSPLAALVASPTARMASWGGVAVASCRAPSAGHRAPRPTPSTATGNARNTSTRMSCPSPRPRRRSAASKRTWRPKGIKLSANVRDDTPVPLAPAICPGLWLGSMRCAYNTDSLTSHGITHVLTVTRHAPVTRPEDDLTYRHIALRDISAADLLGCLPAAAAVIDEGLEAGGVLVHCTRGRSRSVAVVVAYLMMRHGMSLADGMAAARAARPVAQPNAGFLRQLRALEETSGDPVEARARLDAAARAVATSNASPLAGDVDPLVAPETASVSSRGVGVGLGLGLDAVGLGGGLGLGPGRGFGFGGTAGAGSGAGSGGGLGIGFGDLATRPAWGSSFAPPTPRGGRRSRLAGLTGALGRTQPASPLARTAKPPLKRARLRAPVVAAAAAGATETGAGAGAGVGAGAGAGPTEVATGDGDADGDVGMERRAVPGGAPKQHLTLRRSSSSSVGSAGSGGGVLRESMRHMHLDGAASSRAAAVATGASAVQLAALGPVLTVGAAAPPPPSAPHTWGGPPPVPRRP